jgi:hypothetical protein
MTTAYRCFQRPIVLIILLATSLSSACFAALILPTQDSFLFINEFHYDNEGSDQHEFIELVGNNQLDLSYWGISLYNGANNEPYANYSLSSFNTSTWLTPTNVTSQIGFLTFQPTLQNGSPDGLALWYTIDNTTTVTQFISYEGTITAIKGKAIGLTSEDIGLNETNTTPINSSIQLSGTGSRYRDFSWQITTQHSEGMLNPNQFFYQLKNSANKVAEPNIFILWLIGIGLLINCHRCRV